MDEAKRPIKQGKQYLYLTSAIFAPQTLLLEAKCPETLLFMIRQSPLRAIHAFSERLNQTFFFLISISPSNHEISQLTRNHSCTCKYVMHISTPLAFISSLSLSYFPLFFLSFYTTVVVSTQYATAPPTPHSFSLSSFKKNS